MLKKIGRKMALLALLALLAGVRAFGEPTMALKLDSESFVAGRPFEATVFVKGAAGSEPEWDGPGFSVMKRGSQTTGSGTNMTHAFSFRLVPLHAGKLALPVFWVVDDEEELETDPQVVTVQQPRESSDLTVSAAVSSQEVFVGQPVRYTVEWRVGFDVNQLRAVRIGHPLQDMTSFRSFDVNPAAEKTVGLPVGNRRVMAAVTEEEQAGKSMTVHRFEHIIVPQEPGEFTVPPLYMLCSRQSGSKGGFYGNVPGYFDNNFFAEVEAGAEFSEYYAETQPLKLTVKPLPVNDSLTPFSGIVGTCAVQAAVAAADVKVGDPLRLTLRLETPFAQVVKLPDLRRFTELSRRFWIPETQSEGRVENGARVSDFSIRPLHTGVQMVPPLELLIFNPETEHYEIVSTEAIALRVQPNNGQTRFIPPEMAGAEGVRECNADGIWFNRDLAAGPWDRLVAWATAYWYVWLFVPVCVCLALEPLARRKRLERTDPRQARALRAYPRFRRNLKRGKSVEVLLQDYLAARFGLQSGTVTSGDMAVVCGQHGVAESIAHELTDFMSCLDHEQFSPQAERTGDRKRVAELIRKLEGEVSR